MGIVDVASGSRAVRVMQETWGHLAASPDVKRAGWMLFAVSVYQQPVQLIDAEFAGVPDSPWLYEAMNDYIDGQAGLAAGVYRFVGDYWCSEDNTGHLDGSVTVALAARSCPSPVVPSTGETT